MPLALRHRSLYAAFDRFPSRKGSAVHIDRFARTLFDHCSSGTDSARPGGGLLYVLGGEGLPPYQREDEVEIVRYSQPADHFLDRAAGFGARLEALLDEVADSLAICHFRDPWGGLPIVSRPGRPYATVYEVNGLPSIELPFLYPAVPPDVLEAISELERRCVAGADAVVTPSRVTAELLVRDRGAAADRVHVVPNGADIREPDGSGIPAPPGAFDVSPNNSDKGRTPPRYLLYFGALQPWQGVDTALRAFARLRDLEELSLVICASVHGRRAKPYLKLADKLEVADCVHWHFGLAEDELRPWREQALLSLAPLRDCSRNVLQGCAPLKIIESLAAGVPVVASDLPVVRELMLDGVHGRLVAPDRPSELARAIRVLLDFPAQRAEMGAAGRAHVTARFTWAASTDRLREVYSTVRRKDDLIPAMGADAGEGEG